MKAIRQQIRFLRAHDGTQLAVGTVGKGPPLLHAGHWLGHLKRDARSPVWMAWLRELSQSHTYIRYDQRGCGLSENAAAPTSLETWTQDLETVADSLGLKRFALFAMSQGGAPAIAYAARHPDRVSHLVLLGAYAQGRLRRDPYPLQQEEAAVLLDVMRIGSQSVNRAFREIFTMLFIPDGTREQHEWFNDLGPVSTLADNAVATREAFYRLDVTSLAKTVRVPSLVLHARDDAVVPFEQGRRLAALIPSARFVPLDSRNHVLLETEPAWTHFLTELRSFLADDTDNAGHPDRLPGAEQLTPAELQVLTFLARGLHDAAIAARLSKSEKTVRNQVSSILGKLGATSRAEAVARARDAGIGEPSAP
jgi:pimeloyl-ACP methyl ester carboxylesterase/DNA-binding CsgD family transcriptional regulator